MLESAQRDAAGRFKNWKWNVKLFWHTQKHKREVKKHGTIFWKKFGWHGDKMDYTKMQKGRCWRWIWADFLLSISRKAFPIFRLRRTDWHLIKRLCSSWALRLSCAFHQRGNASGSTSSLRGKCSEGGRFLPSQKEWCSFCKVEFSRSGFNF